MINKCEHPLDSHTFHDCVDLQETKVATNQPFIEPHCDDKDHCTVTVCGDCEEELSHDKGTFDALEGPKEKTLEIRKNDELLTKILGRQFGE